MPRDRRTPGPSRARRRVAWALAGGLPALAGCPTEDAAGPFSLELRLVAPDEPDPFDGIDVLRVDLAYADGTDWQVYWEAPQGGSQDFADVPRGEGVVLTVEALAWDDLYEGNAAPVASGTSVPVDLVGQAETSVLVARRGAFSVGASGLAVARHAAEVLAFPDGTLVVAGGLVGEAGVPAVSSLEVARYGGPGDLLEFVAFGDLPRAWHAAASTADAAVLWGGVDAVAVDAFDGGTAAQVAATVAVVRPGPAGAEPEVVAYSDGDLAPRYAASAVALPDGRFAAFGGLGPGDGGAPAGVTTVDVFDAGAGDGAATGDALATARAFPRAVHLGSGQVLVTGGFAPGDVAAGAPRPVVGPTELWSDASGVADTGSLAFPRALHDAVLVSPGRLLVVGGVDGEGAPVPEAEVYAFDPGNPSAGLVLEGTPELVWPRWGARAVPLPDGGAVVCGGRDLSGPVAPCERLSPAADGFAPVVRGGDDGGSLVDGLSEAATGVAATALPGGMALFVGGLGAQATGEVRVFNP